MGRPKLLICRAKHCAERSDALKALLEAADDSCRVEQVRCQKICKGPVVGVQVDGSWEWFRRIRGPKSRAAVLALATGAPMKKRLERRRAKQRSGQVRR